MTTSQSALKHCKHEKGETDGRVEARPILCFAIHANSALPYTNIPVTLPSVEAIA
ncbi:hypothetical protein ABLN97_05390 [Mycobacterium tuberculosis]